MNATRVLGMMGSIAFAAVLATAGGCKKKSTDVTLPDGAVAAVGDPVNADDITRYPNEKKLDSVPASIVRDSVTVHKSPPDGPTVATLVKGASVLEIAQSKDSFLVTFDDPGSGKRMMGWITEDSFTAGAATTATAAGTPRTAPVAAPRADAGVTAADAGAAVASLDAGGASGTIAPPPAGIILIAATAGKCPAGFSNGGDNFCRRTCTPPAAPECPRGTFCVKKGAATVCSATR